MEKFNPKKVELWDILRVVSPLVRGSNPRDLPREAGDNSSS